MGHVNRMNTGRITKQMFHHQPRDQTSVGCPLKRWGKCEIVTGHVA